MSFYTQEDATPGPADDTTSLSGVAQTFGFLGSDDSVLARSTDGQDIYGDNLTTTTAGFVPQERDFLPKDLPYEVKAALCVLYVLITALAVLGNGLVIVVVARTPKLRTVTNTFLVSLAVSDLCIASLNMPFQLRFYLQNEWTLGTALCKMSKYMQGVVVMSSILTLTGIAVDRYYAIMHPLRARNVYTSRRAVIIITVFWFASFLLVLPQLFIQRLEPLLVADEDGRVVRLALVCVEYMALHAYNVAYTGVFYFALYLGPVLVMSVTYGIIAKKLWMRRRIGETPDDDRRLKEKKRIVRMLLVIVALFTISWFPFFTMQLYLVLSPAPAPRSQQFRVAQAALQLLAYANCCINPVVYCFMNDKFQVQALNLLCCRCALNKMSKRRQSSYTYTERLNPIHTSNSVVTADHRLMTANGELSSPLNK